MDCIFCQIVKKKIPAKVIYEDDNTIAFLDIAPNADGHTLVIPKSHVPDLASADEKTLAAVAVTKALVAKKIAAKLNPKGFNFISNQGSEAFQVVFHYHEHIIPKYQKEFGYGFKINHDPKQKNVDDIYELLKIEG